MSAAIRNPLPLWGLYFLLLVAMFATPLSNLSFLLWIIAPLLALTIRNSARKEGLEDDAQHASWIMGSAGLFLLLVFLLIGGMATASSTLIGAESQQRINEIKSRLTGKNQEGSINLQWGDQKDDAPKLDTKIELAQSASSDIFE